MLTMPRRAHLKWFVERRQRHHARGAAAAAKVAASNGGGKERGEGPSSSANGVRVPSPLGTVGADSGVDDSGVHPHRYNRWFASNELQFVHQHQIIEDPEVTAERRRLLPPPTKEDAWRRPHKPTFDPLLPFVRVMDYPKDPDAKHLTPVNIPRWKEYMLRSKPMLPRTWY